MASLEVQDEKKGPKKPEKKLAPEQVLKSEKGNEYLVEKSLGAGGFGEVWKVCLLDDPEKRFAMKTEPNFGVEKRLLRLKCEVNLFEAIAKASNRIDKGHFVKMIDKGKTRDFKYLVMELIWLSLRDVKANICGDTFTPHTIIKIARQTLKGIEALHELGFLHRDIKPENFAVGLPPKDGIVYLLDFGIARPYRDEKGAMRKARKEVKFLGTMKYASIECICRREQSMRDDLECWLYMMIEFYDRNNIMWFWVEDCEPQLHIDLRTNLMEKARELRSSNSLTVPEKWVDIIELLNAMEYDQQGDFTKINLILSQIVIDENIDENLPVDWLGKKPPSPEKPKKEKKKGKKKMEAPKKNSEQTKEDRKTIDGKGKVTTEEEGSEESEDSEEEWEEFLKWKKTVKRAKKKKTNSREMDEEKKGRKKNSKEKTTQKKKKSKVSKVSKASKISKASTKEDDEPTMEVDAREKEKEKEKEKGKEKEKEKEHVEAKKDKEKKIVPNNKKKENTVESNESTNDKDDKAKKNGTIECSANDKDEKEKKKAAKKKAATRTHESKEDDKDEKGIQRKKATKREVEDLKKRKEEKAEKPPPISKVPPPDLPKEVKNAKKADDKK